MLSILLIRYGLHEQAEEIVWNVVPAAGPIHLCLRLRPSHYIYIHIHRSW